MINSSKPRSQSRIIIINICTLGLSLGDQAISSANCEDTGLQYKREGQSRTLHYIFVKLQNGIKDVTKFLNNEIDAKRTNLSRELSQDSFNTLDVSNQRFLPG